jgi:endonuclease YncB( thermonuclease family)
MLLWCCALLAGLQSIGPMATAQTLPEIPSACPGLEPGPKRTVTRIIDGETVTLDDGSELRLIGALAPRAIDVGAEPGQWPMEVAAREELRALLLGKSIEIAFGGERTDRYGRLQAQAFWQDGDKRHWAQGRMLEQGLARAYTLTGNRACAAELLAAERGALEANRGVWGEAAYQIRRADRRGELARYVATFQLIEGRIVRVAQVRGSIYLNFDADWRRGFSVSLRRADRSLLGDFSERPRALEGRSVRVRGWLEHRPGLMIDLSAAGMIEVFERADDTADAIASRPPRRSPPGSTAPGQGGEPRTPDAKTKPPGLVETGR